MTLILRKMRKHAQSSATVTIGEEHDYVVLDQDRNVGRIHREMQTSELKWRWSINTTPFPASPPYNGVENSLEDAKAALRRTMTRMFP